MCCFGTLFSVLISRVGIVIWWLSNPQSHDLPYASWTLPGIVPALPAWMWTVLGGIFVPWTTLAYLLVYPGGVLGYDWIVLGIGLLIDLGSHGGSYYHRNRVFRSRRS